MVRRHHQGHLSISLFLATRRRDCVVKASTVEGNSQGIDSTNHILDHVPSDATWRQCGQRESPSARDCMPRAALRSIRSQATDRRQNHAIVVHCLGAEHCDPCLKPNHAPMRKRNKPSDDRCGCRRCDAAPTNGRGRHSEDTEPGCHRKSHSGMWASYARDA